MLHKVIARRRESSSTPTADGVTSVQGSLSVSNTQQGVITCKSSMDRSVEDEKKPLSIEDVPFR